MESTAQPVEKNQEAMDSEKTDSEKKRFYNIDLLRTVAIIAMIVDHVIISFGPNVEGFATHFGYVFGAVILGKYFTVAHAFMFAMGVCLCFSRRSKPSQLFIRGALFYVGNFVLNFARYGIAVLGDAIITGVFSPNALEVFFTHDIFSFVGLALCLTGLFKLMKLKATPIAIISLGMSLLGTALAYSLDAGNIANFFTSHIIPTDSVFTAFPLLNWYLFVALGMLFGELLQRVSNKDLLYKVLLLGALPAFAIYMTLTALYGPFFLTKHNNYYALGFVDAIGLLSGDLLLLSLFHFLTKVVKAERLKLFVLMSKNVTSIYFISWVIIGTLDVIISYQLDLVLPFWLMYLIVVPVLVASVLLSVLYKFLKGKVIAKVKKAKPA